MAELREPEGTAPRFPPDSAAGMLEGVPSPIPRAAGRRPTSATHFPVNVLALAAGLGVIAMLLARPGAATRFVAYGPLVPCLAVFAVVAAAEWLLRRTGRLARTELSAAALRAVDLRRVSLRLFALAATLALVALAYWLFPEYHGDFYRPYWQFLRALAPFAVLVPVYLVWSDARVAESRDELLEFAHLLIGRWREVDRALIGRHLLGWTVKAYFLPLMTVYLDDEIGRLYDAYRRGGLAMLSGYDGMFHLSYAIDLLFCVVGYTATTRLLDSHMRSVDATMTGWVAALICYQPFYSVIGRF
jgi:hypothetical protein